MSSKYRQCFFEAVALIHLLNEVHFIFHQVCFMFISAYHASDIFETCPHTHRFRTIAVKVMVFAFGSFMPAFILANHVHYSEQVGPLSELSHDASIPLRASFVAHT